MIPPEPDPPEPDPPEPDPPEPEPTLYELECTVTYVTGYPDVPLTFSLFYKTNADSAWALCDTHAFLSGTSSSGSQLINMENIPEGCHSVKLEVSTSASDYSVSMKHPNDSDYVTSLTWGSGNDGWNQDVSTDIQIYLSWDD